MLIFPKAKINIGLRITGKRADGYHEIETIFYPVSLCDALEVVTDSGDSQSDTLVVTGINAGGGLPEDNLVIKAVKKLREQYSFPILKIHLHKVIPSGAGLGGGSSDAASVLKIINKAFKLDISTDGLKSIALTLGSDCPFFIEDQPAYATGRGEVLNVLKPVLRDFYIMLINPRIHIPTKAAYENCTPIKATASLHELINNPVSEWKRLIFNDFEDYVFKKYPVIRIIKKNLYNAGALYSSLSGSGSTVYGIFTDKSDLPFRLEEYLIYEGKL